MVQKPEYDTTLYLCDHMSAGWSAWNKREQHMDKGLFIALQGLFKYGSNKYSDQNYVDPMKKTAASRQAVACGG